MMYEMGDGRWEIGERRKEIRDWMRENMVQEVCIIMITENTAAIFLFSGQRILVVLLLVGLYAQCFSCPHMRTPNID